MKNWTRRELIEAVLLYSNLSVKEIDQKNQIIIKLSKRINRTPRAIEMKIRNFLQADPRRAGETNNNYGKNYAKYDLEVVEDFYSNPDKLFSELKQKTLKINDSLNTEGFEREYVGKQRIDQSRFRGMMMDKYESCCITGINNKELIIAAHIIPWSKNKYHRLNPKNGLLLNALHDKAFEAGLVTIDDDFRVKNSEEILKYEEKSETNFFAYFNNKKINLAEKDPPSVDFLRWHQSKVFKK